MTAKEAYYQAVRAQKRMPELEPIIMQDARYAYWYAQDVIKGRWPEAETIIMQDAFSAFSYARHILKERWLEAEETIAKSTFKEKYIQYFFKESVITKDEVGDFLWQRKKLQGYFAPASLFEDKVSLLDMMVEK